MKLDFEYGQGTMSANLPDNTDIFIPGETVPDPECLPQDWDTLYAETIKSIRNPIGMQTLTEMAHKGSTVVIIIPDIVKGGNQPTSHRKIAIRACIDELYSAGVEKKDILLLFSNGLHPRTSVPEMKTILGDELFNEFYYAGQITSHDSEDYEHLVDLGYTSHTERTSGRYVTEDTELIEQLRTEAARKLAEEFLIKMRGIGYSPARAAALLEQLDTTKEDAQ